MIKSLFNWLKTHSTLTLIIFLAVIALSLFILMQTSPSSSSLPVPNSSPTLITSLPPTPTFSPPASPSSNLLQLIDIQPAPPSFESIWPNERIYFTFNQSLDQTTINYQLKPQTKTRLFFDQTSPASFSILPLNGWETNQLYQITLSKTLSTPSDIGLTDDITITFTRTEPVELDIPDASL